MSRHFDDPTLVIASHNPGKVDSAVDGNLGTRFDTATEMIPGMWFQIEFPEVWR